MRTSRRATAGANALLIISVLWQAACQPRTASSGDSVAMTDPSRPPQSVSPAVPSAPGDSQPPPPAASAAVGDSIELRTDRSRYRAGEKITLTLVNGTARRYSYNPCTRLVERDSAGKWVELREARICTMEAWFIEPNATRSGDTELPEEAGAGRYRVVLSLVEEGSGAPARSRRAVSAPIEIY